MCGFAGGLLSPGESFTDRELLDRMGSVLEHRGPDDSGIHMDGPCGLTHRRLSVIDLTRAGHQPMCNEDESIWMVYNGEVYNFRELRQRFRLDDKGHKFRSKTDTEVLIHLYETLGNDFLRLLNGMFALAIWDGRKKRLILARDPFGIKPLFYTRTGSQFWFASEIKALLEVPGVERSPSLSALYHYLSYDYIPDSLTAFEGIDELSPGHAMEVDWESGGQKTWRYFDYSYIEDDGIGASSALSRSRELLRNAVKRQLVSDVPVGVMLSGGLDSSALTVLMANIREDSSFHTFSIGFEDPSFDESGYAEIVAERVGTRHHKVLVTPDKVSTLLPKYLAHIDEPYADGSAIPTWLLAEEASRHVTVLLSGEGGDEVFAGYDTHAAYKVRSMYRSLVPEYVRRKVIRELVHRLPVSHRKLSFEFKAKRFTDGAELGVIDAHYSWREVLSTDAKLAILNEPERFMGFPPSSSFFEEVYSRCRSRSELNRLLCIDTCCHLPHDLMIKNDRMTMAHSIEARVPFTDSELYGFLTKVPVKHKLPWLRKKHLLRKAMDGLLPDRIIRKKKVGLEMPYSDWMRNRLREQTLDYLTSSRLMQTGLFNPDGIAKLWDQHDRKQVDHGRALWGLLNYMIWYDMYISSSSYKSHILHGVHRNSGS